MNGPISTNEIILKKQLERSHFISLLYDCKIGDEQLLILEEIIKKDKKINFFKKKPKDFLKLHEIYAKYF